MEILTILLIALSLSFDTFAVSISSGLILKQIDFYKASRIAIVLAIFQGVMPVIGWLIGIGIKDYAERFDHWIAFTILGLLGVKMIYESFKSNPEDRQFNPLDLKVMIGMAIATSIDALIVGFSFALLDFAEQYPIPLKHTIIMETGGMKGRRKEMIRQELHAILQQSFSLSAIHSEYGMTELLSQAYSKGEGIYHCPPWMKILLRDDEDPLRVITSGSGVVNVIDLANIHSCSFIATDDAGKVYPDGSFEILGRVDGSDMRGCSLLVINQ